MYMRLKTTVLAIGLCNFVSVSFIDLRATGIIKYMSSERRNLPIYIYIHIYNAFKVIQFTKI